MKEAYQNDSIEFGQDYIVPMSLDDRLLVEISAAIADAALEEGFGEMCPAVIEMYKDRLRERVAKKKKKVE